MENFHCQSGGEEDGDLQRYSINMEIRRLAMAIFPKQVSDSNKD